MKIRLSVVALVGGLITAAGTAAPLHAVTLQVNFPSASSTVVGSVGFLDATEIGYFWSVSRGDRVQEAFASGPAFVTQAVFDFFVPTNVLNSGASVNWDVLINSVVVGSFTINEGQTGPVHLAFAFAPIAGPNYAIKFVVTNEVPSGQGSHTLGYAGAVAGTAQLVGTGAPAPVVSAAGLFGLALLLGGVGGLALRRAGRQ